MYDKREKPIRDKLLNPYRDLCNIYCNTWATEQFGKNRKDKIQNRSAAGMFTKSVRKKPL